MTEIERLLKLKLQKLEEEQQEKDGLPHLHLHKNYSWSRRFKESLSKIIVLVCGNQLGKSTSQICRMIELATNPELWPKFWPQLTKEKLIPSQFWYLYPTRDVATMEFVEKWTTFLPKNQYKDHPTRGWKERWSNDKIFSIEFNSGVTLYFKTYGQDLESLMAGTVSYVGSDEEPPFAIFPELSQRISACDGYMSFVFTATEGQEEWREIVEEKTRLTEAEVIQVSKYDCQFYEDGTPSKWTNDRIAQDIARCGTESEIQMRVFGRFVVSGGRKYPTFTRTKNMIKPHAIPFDWARYVGIDIGGGGESHPAAISFIAVRPDMKRGVVYKFWRGDHVTTTAQDVLQKYVDMREQDPITLASFDWGSKDFGTIAARSNIPVARAEKSHAIGEGLLNSLFRNGMLYVFDLGDETNKLANEFLSLLEKTDKRKAKDDGIDSLRYGICPIPFDWADVTIAPREEEETRKENPVDRARREFVMNTKTEDSLEEEMNYLNELAGT